MKNGISYSSGSGRWLTGMAGALLALGTLIAQETFRITRMEPLADRLELSWEAEPALDYFEGIKAGSGSASGTGGTFEWKNADPRFPPTGNFAR